MKLISPKNVKDYYDGVAHTLREDTPVYLRQTDSHYLGRIDSYYRGDNVVAEWRKKLGQVWEAFVAMPKASFCERMILGFCGRLYPMWSDKSGTIYESVEEISGMVAAHQQQEKYDRSPYGGRFKHWNYYEPAWYKSFDTKTAKTGKPLCFSKPDIKRFLDELRRKGDDAFVALGVPVFLIQDYRGEGESTSSALCLELSSVQLVLNPLLKDLDFHKQMDAFSCFQEIDQYLGNQLATQVDIEPRGITDKLKAESHGYDDWSFRRHAEDDPKAVKRKRKEAEQAARKSEEITLKRESRGAEAWAEDLVLKE